MRLGGDVLDDEDAARREQVAEALEHRQLIGGRNVVHDVEHVRAREAALERHVARVARDELVLEAEARADALRHRDATLVRIDADDASRRLRLPEVRGEETEAAADVEDAPLVRAGAGP